MSGQIARCEIVSIIYPFGQQTCAQCPLCAGQALPCTLGARWFPPSWREKGKDNDRSLVTILNAKEGLGIVGDQTEVSECHRAEGLKESPQAGSGYPGQPNTGKLEHLSFSKHLLNTRSTPRWLPGSEGPAMSITDKGP